jgi:hypothetical protein
LRQAICLDEPFDLSEGARLIVTVLELAPGEERPEWLDLSARGLARAYEDSEPEYSSADLLQLGRARPSVSIVPVKAAMPAWKNPPQAQLSLDSLNLGREVVADRGTLSARPAGIEA